VTVRHDQTQVGVLGGIAIGDAHALVLPLSRRYCIALGPHGRLDHVDQRIVDQLNTYQVRAAQKYVYFFAAQWPGALCAQTTGPRPPVRRGSEIGKSTEPHPGSQGNRNLRSVEWTRLTATRPAAPTSTHTQRHVRTWADASVGMSRREHPRPDALSSKRGVSTPSRVRLAGDREGIRHGWNTGTPPGNSWLHLLL
jgi:hypothetical protein